MYFFFKVFKAVFGENFYRPLCKDTAGINTCVDKVNRDAGYGDSESPRVADAVSSGEGREERRMDVHDTPGMRRNELRRQNSHEPGENDPFDASGGAKPGQSALRVFLSF